MKHIRTIETIFMGILIVLYFFAVKEYISPLIYLFPALIFALYLNPIKLILIIKNGVTGRILNLLVYLLISATIIEAFITLMVGMDDELRTFNLILLVITMVFLFLTIQKKRHLFYLLNGNLFLLAISFLN